MPDVIDTGVNTVLGPIGPFDPLYSSKHIGAYLHNSPTREQKNCLVSFFADLRNGVVDKARRSQTVNNSMILTATSTALTVVGLTVEFVGVVLLGRQFLQMTWRETLSTVLSASFSKISRDAMEASAVYGGERHAENARGLSFVCVGLLLQISGACVDFAARLELHQSTLHHYQALKPEAAKEGQVPTITTAPEQAGTAK